MKPVHGRPVFNSEILIEAITKRWIIIFYYDSPLNSDVRVRRWQVSSSLKYRSSTSRVSAVALETFHVKSREDLISSTSVIVGDRRLDSAYRIFNTVQEGYLILYVGIFASPCFANPSTSHEVCRELVKFESLINSDLDELRVQKVLFGITSVYGSLNSSRSSDSCVRKLTHRSIHDFAS